LTSTNSVFIGFGVVRLRRFGATAFAASYWLAQS
jgi:hypothetical protein